MSTTKNPAPIATEDLVEEIERTLLNHRNQREHHLRLKARTNTARDISDPHEITVMLDVTLALLIRHRLPIDADRAAKAVRTARTSDARAWAGACAEHLASIARERNP